MPSCPCGFVKPDAGPAREGWVCPACGRFLPAEAQPAATEAPLLVAPDSVPKASLGPGSAERYAYRRKSGLGDRLLIEMPGGETLLMERPRQTLRALGAFALLLGIPTAGITATIATLAGPGAGPLRGTALALLVLLSLAGGVMACVLMIPRGHLALYADPDAQEPLLYLKRGMRPFRCEYQVQAPDGQGVALIRKSNFSWWAPKPWFVQDAEGMSLWSAAVVGDSMWTWKLAVVVFLPVLLCVFCPVLVLAPLAWWSMHSSGLLHTRYHLLDPDGAQVGWMRVEAGGVFTAIRRLDFRMVPPAVRTEIERQLAVALAGAIALNPSGAR